MRSTVIQDLLLAPPKCYEFLQSGFVRGKHEHLRLALAWADLPVPCKVLDIGCGTGQDAPLFADKKRFSYVGVDLSEKYVQRASQRFPGMTFRKADICLDTIDVSGFDLVIIDSVLHHIDDSYADDVLSKLPNHLNGNGFLVVQDMFCPDIVGVNEFLPYLITRLDRGAYCRDLKSLTQLLEKYFKLESQMTYTLKLMGLRCCNMAVFVCKPKSEMSGDHSVVRIKKK